MSEIDKLLRDNIRKLAPYSTARDEYDGPIGIYLDANENPFDNGYNRYPDPHQRQLKKVVARLKNVQPDNVFLGNGSDEAIDLVFRIFCEPGKNNAVSIAPTYGMYKVAADVNDVQMREVQLAPGYAFHAGDLLGATDENTKLAFLCSPNNPTGNLLDPTEVEKFIHGFSGITVLDEAYIDFASHPGFLPRLSEFPRLIILQTLSKAWAMAGLRLGMAFASAGIITYMSRVKYPYNINGPTQTTVADMLEKGVGSQTGTIVRQRDKLILQLKTVPYITEVYPSDANFILVKTPDPGCLYTSLIKKGFIVRDRSRVRGCEGCVRITVGTPEENERLLDLLNELGKNDTI